MTRYESMFERCAAEGRGAIVPFVMLGDPTASACEAIIEALIADGADALELGIPFSDPVADGVVIQEAHLRALNAGIGFEESFAILGRIRAAHPDLPIGLLVYANVPFSIGIERFYARCAEVGVDSVLIPDVPIREGNPFSKAALACGVDSVYIAPPSASPRTLNDVARSARGYVYAVSRVGVTGADHEASTVGLHEAVATLREQAAAPVLLGFGISRPEHVRDAIEAGADGAISGSAIVRIIAQHAAEITAQEGQESSPAMDALLSELRDFFVPMIQATVRGSAR